MGSIPRACALLATSAAIFLFSVAPRGISAAAGDPVTVKLQSELAALHARVQEIDQKLAALDGAIVVDKAGVTISASNIALKAANDLSVLAAATLALKSSKDVQLNAGNNLTMQAAADVNLNAARQLSAKGNAAATFTSSALTSVGGAVVKLNGGGAPVMTAGSPQGSPTVLAP
jgi:paraquat-inducible protein B